MSEVYKFPSKLAKKLPISLRINMDIWNNVKEWPCKRYV